MIGYDIAIIILNEGLQLWSSYATSYTIPGHVASAQDPGWAGIDTPRLLPQSTNDKMDDNVNVSKCTTSYMSYLGVAWQAFHRFRP